MRVTNYQRLSAAPEPEGGARAGATRAWAALRRTAAGVARLYAARWRWAARRLWGGRRAAPPLRAKAAAAAARYEYDSASYARNFDDGTWMAEEGVSWHARIDL
ncbi:hypothetical protein C2845_PM03G01630 [Panicum miliaceum]|uniref:Uncharacterized protein n=1 Tax=Panicum miliaceum TaxID=4540 RepID=A0A3L6TC76_PANMI|nr:hypothetical protein C2845_PM03G01630 [Panicum miliaceum]